MPTVQRARRRCAFCFDPLVPRATGRPARYCGDACRQAGFRRVTKLRATGAAERVLAAHGLGGAELLRMASAVAAKELQRRGAYLGDRHTDLISFLVVAGCRAAVTYDPDWPQMSYGRNGGNSLRSYLGDIMARRVGDFYRSRGEGFSDRRYKSHAELVPTTDEMLVLLGGDAVDAEDTDDHELATAAAELGAELSEEARATLELIAVPAARGYMPLGARGTN